MKIVLLPDINRKEITQCKKELIKLLKTYNINQFSNYYYKFLINNRSNFINKSEVIHGMLKGSDLILIDFNNKNHLNVLYRLIGSKTKNCFFKLKEALNPNC